MSTRSSHFKLGIFVIAGLTLAAIVIVIFGAGRLFQQKVMMETYIDESVQGLDVGSPVKRRGVRVGSVQSIDFVSSEYRPSGKKGDFSPYGRYVLVKFSIRPDAFAGRGGESIQQQLDRLIGQGLRVRLASQGLTGTAYLEADYLDPERNPPLKIAWEPENYYLPSAPSVISRYSQSLDEVTRELQKVDIAAIARHLDAALVSLASVAREAKVGELRQQAGTLLSDLQETSSGIRSVAGGAALRSTLGELHDLAATLNAALSDSDLKGTLTNLHQTSATLVEDLPATLARLQQTARRADNLLSRQQQNIEVTMENLRVMSANLREVTETAKRYPAQLLFGRPPEPDASAK